MEKITLVWLTKQGSQTNFEKQYIEHRLFGGFICDNILRGNDLLFANAVLIFSCNTPDPDPDYWKVVEWYKQAKLPYFLVHLSDERCSFDPKHYTGAKHVWRSYGGKRYDGIENVSTIPLGFQTGFMNPEPVFDDRERNIDAVFAGSMKQDRQSVVDVLKSVPNTMVKTTTHFNDPNGIPITGMIDVYKESFLAPCPMGWHHADSFRIMECLEWNCIPVIKMENADYFDSLYPIHPFLVVQNWDEINSYIKDLKPYEARCRKNAFNWYTFFKDQLKRTVKAKYESLL